MNVTLDLSNGVSGDMLLAALLQMAMSRHPDRDHLTLLRSAGSAMAPTEVSALKIDRPGGPAVQVRTTWKPDGNGIVTAEDMSNFLEKALRAVSANDRTSRRARSMLSRLLGAEMAVHNVRAPSQLHLHETGTPDTLVDIIGASYLFDLMEMDGDWVRATAVALGSGTVATDHGVFQVPVPAVRHLLRGVPALSGPVEGELATPTGMAIVLSLVEEWIGPIASDSDGAKVVGRGAGSKTFDGHPNVLRILEGP